MLTNDDLQAIKGIIKEGIDPIKKQLDTVEMKVESVNDRVGKLESKVDKVESTLTQIIKESQEDTITALTALINEGYNTHEERLKKVEDALHISHSQ